MDMATVQKILSQVDPNELPDEVCQRCGTSVQLNGVVSKVVPVTHPKNTTGHPLPVGVPCPVCIKCLIMDCLEEHSGN